MSCLKHTAKLLAGTTGLVALTALTACTNPTSTAGSVSRFTNGTIVEMERISIDAERSDTETNSLIGAVIGGIAGNLLNNHTTGTLVGAGAGAIAGNLASRGMNREDGVRLTVDTDEGTYLVDQPFSCSYQVGQQVRLINAGGNNAQVQIYENGAYRTVQKNEPRDCPVR